MEESFPILFLKYATLEDETAFCHDSYDFLYILSGACTLMMPERTGLYEASDLTMLPPQTQVSLKPERSCTLLAMGLRTSFLEQNLGLLGSLLCDSVLEPNNDYAHLKRLLGAIATKYLEGPAENRLSLYGLLYELLVQLKQDNFFSPVTESEIPEKYRPRANAISQYLDRHYASPVSLSDLAEVLFLSPQYLSKFFKKHLHKNFKDFLLEIRLFHAYHDICYTSDPLTAIALRCGFTDVSSFGKAFRAHWGCTPSTFRKRLHTQRLEHEYARHRSDVPSGFSDPFDTQYLSVNVCEGIPFPHTFAPLINIGLCQNLRLELFRRELLKAQKHLHFSYVRMQGLFGAGAPRPDSAQMLQNLDYLLHFLYTNHMIPFFELGECTSPLLPTHREPVAHGRAFFEALEIFLRHVSQTFPAVWTNQWIFELYKPPKEEADAYAKTFSRIRDLLNRYLPHAKLGGFGAPADCTTASLQAVFTALTQRQLHPDFFSASFTLMRSDRQGFYADRHYLRIQAQRLRGMLARFFPNCPFFITSWNSAFLPNTPIQQSCFQAAFICKTVLELAPCCDLMSYWLFCDVPNPHASLLEGLSFWGHGMLSENFLPMPAFYAFALLEFLGTRLVQAGEHYCVTQSEPGHYQVLTFHYAPFLSTTSVSPQREIPFFNLYTLFESPPCLKMQLTLTNLLPGTYRITRYVLGRANGSPLDTWIGGYVNSNLPEIEYLTQIKPLPPQQLQYLKSACTPEVRTIFKKADEALSFNVQLQPHDIILHDLVRRF